MTILPPHQTLQFKGQEIAERNFEHAFNAKRLGHAIILHGPKGVGKATAAFSFARRLLSEKLIPGHTTSDENQQLNSLIANLSHPDLLYIRAQDDDEKKSKRIEITVDDIRQIKQFVALTPSISLWRVIIIDSANDLNRSASNALLKVLEDPPPLSIIFLIAHHLGRLLPTIRSRCQKISFSPISNQLMQEWLLAHYREADKNIIEKVISLADGSIGRVVELLQDNNFETYQYMIQALENISTGQYDPIQKFLDQPLNFPVMAQLLLAWLHQKALQSTKVIKKDIRLENNDKVLPLSNFFDLYNQSNQLILSSIALHLDPKQTFISLFTLVKNALSSFK